MRTQTPNQSQLDQSKCLPIKQGNGVTLGPACKPIKLTKFEQTIKNSLVEDIIAALTDSQRNQLSTSLGPDVTVVIVDEAGGVLTEQTVKAGETVEFQLNVTIE